MIVDFDPNAIPKKLQRPEEVDLVNKLLGGIGYRGRCVSIGFAYVRHPTATKRAHARIDGLERVAWLRRPPPLGENTVLGIARMRKVLEDANDLQERLAKVLIGTTTYVYKKRFRMPDHPETRLLPWFHSEDTVEWDWLVRKEFEDAVLREIPEIVGIATSGTFQPKRPTSSNFAFAVLDTKLPKTLDRGYLPASAFSHLRLATEVTNSGQCFEEAILEPILSHIFSCSINGEQGLHFEPNYTRVSAEELMAFHIESVCSWRYRKHERHASISVVDQNLGSLFSWCNRISHQYHESQPIKGKIYLRGDRSFVRTAFQLLRPISYADERAMGKLILAGSDDSYPILNAGTVSEFGVFTEPDNADEKGASSCRKNIDIGSVVEFRGAGSYRWIYRDTPVLDVVNGTPSVPVERITEDVFRAEFSRCFPRKDHGKTWSAVRELANCGHGTMLIVTDNAESESKRIDIGFSVPSYVPTRQQLAAFARIDGGLLSDSSGRLFSFGFLLDGETVEGAGEVARGARYNSAAKYIVSYVKKTRKKLGLMIAVISQDGMISLESPFTVQDRLIERKAPIARRWKKPQGGFPKR